MGIKSRYLLVALSGFLFCLINIYQGYKLNYSAIMKEYYLLCGPDYFCYGGNITHKMDILPNYSYKHLKVCPECFCDTECITRGDCCPDMFFAFPELKCVNRTIINARMDRHHTEQSSALMVTGCKETSDQELMDKCLKLKDTKSRLTNPPVSARGDVLLTFYNKYCAECNGVTNYSSWFLDINCTHFVDFNFLSTIDEMIDMAHNKKCILQYYRPGDIHDAEKEENCFDVSESNTLFTSCNRTKEWEHLDYDIKKACESFFKGKFRIFKNVFCYLCNPSGHRYFTDIIGTCNITGQWKVYDEGLERACRDLPPSSGTTPFKNVFCHLCNRGNNSSQYFVDVDGDIEEHVLDNTEFRFEYTLSIINFSIEYFEFECNEDIHVDKTLAQLSTQPFSKTSFRLTNGTLMNMTNLLTQMAALRISSVNACPARRSLLPEGFSRECSCDLACLMKRYGCCDDLLIELPTACRDEFELSKDIYFRRNSKGYLVINGCFQENTHAIFRDRCSSRSKIGGIFSSVPLTDENDVSYNNFYCILCNLESKYYLRQMNDSKYPSSKYPSKIIEKDDIIKSYIELLEDEQKHFDIWDLYLVCPAYLDFSHVLIAGDLVELARHVRCKIEYNNSIDTSSYCRTETNQIKRPCEDVYNWTFTDPEVDWACNNLVTQRTFFAPYFGFNVPEQYEEHLQNHFKNKISEFPNVFCAMCKPAFDFKIPLIENCSSGNDSTYCTDLPLVYYYYPFKNYQCLICNNLYVGVIGQPYLPTLTIDYERITGKTWYPLLRNMFSLSQDNLVSGQSTPSDRCDRDQVYDGNMDMCRNITCFSGKVLKTNSCIPLLEITQSLRYSMGLKAVVYHDNQYTQNMTPVMLILKRKLRSTLNVGKSYLEDISYTVLNNSMVFNYFSLFIRMHFFVESSVPRLDLEMSLLNFRKSTIQTYGYYNISKIQLSPCEDTGSGYTFPLDAGLKYSNGELNDSPPQDVSAYFTARITEALICHQIEFSMDELNITGNNSGLSLAWKSTSVSFEQFIVTPDGNYRICVDYLNELGYFSSSIASLGSNDKLKNLWIVSLVCTIVSIACLVPSLFVYCLFPFLQTTPGKLLIIMMSSLLTTLSLMLLSSVVVDRPSGCVIVGILLHFSWLCVFTSMQACNFHLFRTFTRTKPRGNTSNQKFDKTLFKYSVYVFGVPLGFVLFNILISRISNTYSALGYGGTECFIENIFSRMAVFIFPVAFMCISNLIFFSLSIRAIHNTPSPEGNVRDRNELKIYLRLSSVTGFSWLLQIIDSFLPLTAFSFFVTIVNSLQGLFIFLAFIVNRRNIQFIRTQLTNMYYSSDSTSPKSDSMTIPQSSRNL